MFWINILGLLLNFSFVTSQSSLNFDEAIKNVQSLSESCEIELKSLLNVTKSGKKINESKFYRI